MGKLLSVRDALKTDFPVVEVMHRMGGLDYQLPDLTSPLVLVHKVCEGPEGVVGSCFLRLTAETFLLLDTSLSAYRQLKTVQALQPAILLEAYRLGLDDLNARIPETIERKFTNPLNQLGWTKARPGWSAWSRQCVMP